jgi:hypothetical protein
VARTVKIWTEEELADYYRIINEELVKGGITWAQLVLGGMMRPALQVRWGIFYRLYTELNWPVNRIARFMEVDRTTVVNAVRKMEKTGGVYFDARSIHYKTAQAHRRRLMRIGGAANDHD